MRHESISVKCKRLFSRSMVCLLKKEKLNNQIVFNPIFQNKISIN